MAIKIAEYAFNSAIDTLPTFNDGFVPAIKTESRTIFVTMMESTFNIPIISLNDIISIEIPKYEGNVNFQKTVESDSDYIRVEYVDVTSGPYIHIDSTGKCTVGCSEPWDMNENIVIKYKSGSGYIYTDVNNGNGTTTRTITSDTLPTSISFAYKTGLISLSYLNTSNITNMSSMFNNCENMSSLDVSSFDTSKVTNMSQLFYKCVKLTTIEGLNNWNTNQVTDISHMFNRCYELTELNLSNFNTRNVTNMSYMFQECNTLITIKGLNIWNTSNVTNISFMFDGCIELIELNLTNFNTSKVTTMYGIFQNCKKLRTLNINNFNINDTVNTSWMFYNCSSLISVDMDNSDVNSINDIITYLPTKTPNSPGTIIVPKKALNSVDATTANSKYWNIIKTLEYTFTLDTLKYLLANIKNKFIAKEEMSNKVDKVEGKELSSNNFSDEDANNINDSFNDAEVIDNVSSELTTLKFHSGNNETKTIDLDI